MFAIDRRLVNRIVLLGALILLVVLLLSRNRVNTMRAATNVRPMVVAQVLDVDCPPSLGSFDSTFTKVSNIGTFSVQSADSLVEVLFNGHLYVIHSTSIFELRVDDLPSSYGRARTFFLDTGLGSDLPPLSATIIGIFDSLEVGEHTVSMWAKSLQGSGTFAGIDHGCRQTDSVVIKE